MKGFLGENPQAFFLVHLEISRKGDNLLAAILYGSQKSPKNHTVKKIVEKQMVINYLSLSKYHLNSPGNDNVLAV